MARNKTYLAVDLGASSGRVMAGLYNGRTLKLEEVHRFSNSGCRLPSGWHWDTVGLFSEIKKGLVIAGQKYGATLVSAGVDTWGVDYGLFDKKGLLLGVPYMYRDERTDGVIPKVNRRISKKRLYENTGIQTAFFNTLNQLYAEKLAGSTALSAADHILFTPDLLHYWLSGKMANEYSIASTSQLLDASTRNWSKDVIKAAGLPSKIFGKIVKPGTKLGSLLPELREELGIKKLDIVVPGSHDTASAVAAVPTDLKNPAYLSSGTWSLLGTERKSPLLTKDAEKFQFTNEGGVCGTIRVLKNITGLWLLQESRRIWNEKGDKISFAEIEDQARKAKPFTAFINPDDASFNTPGDMPARIREYCRKTGQKVPRTKGQLARVVYESLALRYQQVFQDLESLNGSPFSCLHVVGGGSQDGFLNQLTANALNKPVVAGPVEATAIGNVLIQMITSGDLKSLADGRALVKASFPAKTFQPKDGKDWDRARAAFKRIV